MRDWLLDTLLKEMMLCKNRLFYRLADKSSFLSFEVRNGSSENIFLKFWDIERKADKNFSEIFFSSTLLLVKKKKTEKSHSSKDFNLQECQNMKRRFFWNKKKNQPNFFPKKNSIKIPTSKFYSHNSDLKIFKILNPHLQFLSNFPFFLFSDFFFWSHFKFYFFPQKNSRKFFAFIFSTNIFSNFSTKIFL